MAVKAQLEKTQAVTVVETDILDRMNETRELIAQRAYEIYRTRGGGDGSDRDDWFIAEDEVLPKLPVHYDLSDDAVRLQARVDGFNANDLIVEVGHRQVVVCGVHSNSNGTGPAGSVRKRKIMGIVELPCDVDPGSATASLEGSTLRVSLPKAV